jgi:hypothetical protein
MGNCTSTKRMACNYDCEICKKTGNLPNILGKFIMMENDKIRCTGCNTVFEKNDLPKICKKDILYVEKDIF